MNKLIVAIALMFLAAPAAVADQAVRGYVKRDGTYVAPYTRTTPNSTPMDNYSTRGNTNPYTGQAGTVSPSGVYGSGSSAPAYGLAPKKGLYD